METSDVIQEIEQREMGLNAEPMRVNMGPAHPATHGTVRIVLDLSGETVVNCDVQIGYLHRGFEKMCERGCWTQVLPYVDRANYVSPMLNNVGYVLACEKLMDAEVPERCQWYRMVLGELARIADHLTCTGAMMMELGAFTGFLWLMKGREAIYDVLEEETGARLTHSFARVGGMAKPPTEFFKTASLTSVDFVRSVLGEAERLLLGNRIFLDRLEKVGVMSAEDAISLGWTGPCLRASGVPYDVRKAHPYLKYGEVEFEVPVGAAGDCLDRVLVRFEEVKESIRIIEQSLRAMPDSGPISINDPYVTLPPKLDVYTTIEGMIQHFKIIMEGIKLPAGEVYSYTEAANGELGFYLISDGSGTPYRVRMRPPCFFTTAGVERLITGHMVADIVPCFGSVNMVGGECDR